MILHKYFTTETAFALSQNCYILLSKLSYFARTKLLNSAHSKIKLPQNCDMPAIKLIFEQPVNERAAVIVGGIKSRAVGSSSVVSEFVRIGIRLHNFTAECALFVT